MCLFNICHNQVVCRIRRRQEIGRHSLQRFSESRTGKKKRASGLLLLHYSYAANDDDDIRHTTYDDDTENGLVVTGDIVRASREHVCTNRCTRRKKK